MNPPRNRKGETGSPPPNVNASEFYPNHPLSGTPCACTLGSETFRRKKQSDLYSFKSLLILSGSLPDKVETRSAGVNRSPFLVRRRTTPKPLGSHSKARSWIGRRNFLTSLPCGVSRPEGSQILAAFYFRNIAISPTRRYCSR